MDLRRGDLGNGVRRGSRGFTLLEMMVATVILLMIMALVAAMTDQVGKIWKKSNAQIESFESARAAFSTMTMRLRQATLNTYLDYYDASGNVRTAANSSTFVPASYARASNLHFVVDQASALVPLQTGQNANFHPTQAVFFQAPLGFTVTTASYGNLPNILNACGYYVEFNTDAAYIPSVVGASVNGRYRYRLMEFLQPTESFAVYSTASTGSASSYDSWFTNFLPPNVTQANAPLRMLAENIIALVILPELSPRDASSSSLAPNYTYDTRAGTITSLAQNQLPPLLRVVMVAIDEPSAKRLSVSAGTSPPSAITTDETSLFQTSSQLDADLNTLGSKLSSQKISYRVFDTDIAIHGAKWSTQ